MNKRLNFLSIVLFGLALVTHVINTEGFSAIPQTKESIKIEYIAHASFRIHSPAGQRIIVDPYGSQIWLGYNYPKGLKADAVLITHPHYDHDGGTSRGGSFPFPKTMRVLRDPGQYAIGDIAVKGVKGKHADPYGKEFGQINTIWVIDIAGLRIAHVGDNGPISPAAIKEMGRVDILMLPIDGVYHILKETEIQAIFKALNPKVIVPMHYQIPELEHSPDHPKNLGPIDPWVKGKKNVLRLESNERQFALRTLPERRQIVVFQHSPQVTKGEETK